MESPSLCKLIWGSDSDLIALRWNPTEGKRIHSKNVIDVQLGYSRHGRRLGMERAMNDVPYSKRSSLSSAKHDPSYYFPQGENKRCTAIPASRDHEIYAMDDLHRIELILLHKPCSSFLPAKELTERDITKIDSGAFLFEWLQLEQGYYDRNYGSRKSQKAVQFRRAIVHIKMVLAGQLSASQKMILARVDSKVANELRLRKVVIKDGDLSFVGDE